jgi:rhamnosyl/mannosyltransferase
VKILHLSKFYPPDPGGLEHVVACLAEGAARAGHEVRVVCATGSGWRRDPGKRVTMPPRRGVVVVRIPTRGVVWSQPVAPGYFAASRWPADVVYIHRPHPLADLAAALGPRRPTIVLHHSDVQRQRAAAAAYRPLAWHVVHRAAAVVVATRAHLAHARDLGRVRADKVRVIPFGVDERRFAPGHEAPPPFFAALKPEPVGLFVGRLVGYKGLDVLLRAVSGSALRVVIVGGGALRQWLEREVAAGGLSDRVVLAGEVDDSVLPACYRAADYVVLPSTSPAEMFGISLVEGMACGRPVVSTGLTTGVSEVNVPDVTGLVVPPGDAAGLRTAMERLAADRGLRERLGAAGRRRVEERFTLARMIEAHLGLCQELASRTPPA